MTTSEPIRVALVGLTANPGLYAWANNVHFPYLQQNPHYQIVAILGSSRQSAKNAIKKFELSETVKAYGSPEELACDPNVDLVSIVTKVHFHKEVTECCISHGKDVFVEWPLGMSFRETKELAALAQEKSVRTMVGLQARHSAVVIKAARLIQEGAVGTVLSTTVAGTVPTGGGIAEPNGIKYSLDVASGATMLDVHFAHFIEAFCSVLGEVKSLSSIIATQHKTTNIIDHSTGEVLEKNYPKTAPDQILMQGILDSGAVVSFHMRGGDSISGGFRWLIYGSRGEVEVTGPAMLLHIGMPAPWKIRISDASGKVTAEHSVEGEPTQPAVAALYEAYQKDDANGVPDFEHAVCRHRIVQAMSDSFRERKVVSL